MDPPSSCLEDSCRLCVKNFEAGAVKIPLHESETTYKIFVCVSITVRKSDPFPPWICYDCSSQLSSFYIFKESCIAANEKLHQLYYKITEQPGFNRDKEGNNLTTINSLPPSCDNIEFVTTDITLSSVENIVVKEEPFDPLVFNDSTENDGESQTMLNFNYNDCNLNTGNNDVINEVYVKAEPMECDPDEYIDEYPANTYDNILIKSECDLNYEGSDSGRNNDLEINFSSDDKAPEAIQKQKRAIDHRILPSRPYVNKDIVYRCSICNAQFQQIKDYEDHQTEHSLSTDEVFTCTICPMTFEYRNCLWKHEMQHTKDPDQISCKLCKLKFSTLRDLKTHMKFHLGEIISSTTSNEPTAMKITPKVNQVSEIDLMDFLCQCGKEYYTRTCYNTHKLQCQALRAHAGIFDCNICDAPFYFKGALTKHEQLVHPLRSEELSYKQYNPLLVKHKTTSKRRRSKFATSHRPVNTVIDPCYVLDGDVSIAGQRMSRNRKCKPEKWNLICEGKRTVKQCNSYFPIKKQKTPKSDSSNKLIAREKYKMQYVPPEVKEPYCEVCNTEFQQHHDLLDHVCRGQKSRIVPIVLNPDVVFACQLCTMTFHCIDKLASHQEGHRQDSYPNLIDSNFNPVPTTSKQQIYPMSSPKVASKPRSVLQVHAREDKNYPCRECGLVLSTSGGRANHVAHMHRAKTQTSRQDSVTIELISSVRQDIVPAFNFVNQY